MGNGFRRAAAVLLVGMVLTVCAAAAEPAPVDIQRHWAGAAIYTLLEHNLTQPRADGRFQPDHAATREEGAAMLYALLQDKAAAQNAPALAGLADHGMLSGYEDGALRPADPLTRGELASMLYQCQQTGGALTPDSVEASAVPLSDLDGCADAEAIRYFCDRGILTGRPDGTFHPGDPMTRGELAAVFCRLSGYAPVPPAVELPIQNVISVPYSSQIYPVRAWVGCEPTSLYMGLRANGHALDVDLKAFLDGMPFDACNPARGFVGSPYRSDHSKRTTIYPPILAEYGRRYGADVQDFSGSSPGELQAELLAGNPVVVYMTLWWEEPRYRDFLIDGQTQRLLYNNHAVLACGYNSETGAYYVSDPYNLNQKDKALEYKYWVDGKLFERLYNVRRHAVVVRG